MKNLRIICLLLAALLFFISSGAVFAYSSNSPGFSVTPPQGWTTEPVSERMVRFYHQNEPVRFIVETTDIGKASLSEFKDASIKTLTSGLTDYKVISETEISLDSKPALQVRLQVPDIELVAVLCVKDGWGYRITAFEKNGNLGKYSADFQQFLSSFSFSAQIKFPFRDDFNRVFNDAEWYWVREDASGWSLNNRTGFLRITVGYGDLWGGYNNAKNLLLRPAPTGDFEISTAVTFNPASDGQQAGLIIYQDDDRYLLLSRAYAGEGIVDFTRENEADISSWPLSCKSGVTYLRIARRGANYTGYLSADGKMWKKVYSYPDTVFASPKIGLYAFQSVEKAASAADFDYFTLSEVTVNQPPKAEFLINPLQPSVGDTISFASTSVDPDGDTLKHAWYLDGVYLEKAGNSPLWTWENAVAGKHTVRLVVDDGNGGIAEYTLSLNMDKGGGIPFFVFIILEIVVLLVVVVLLKKRGRGKK